MTVKLRNRQILPDDERFSKYMQKSSDQITRLKSPPSKDTKLDPGLENLFGSERFLKILKIYDSSPHEDILFQPSVFAGILNLCLKMYTEKDGAGSIKKLGVTDDCFDKIIGFVELYSCLPIYQEKGVDWGRCLNVIEKMELHAQRFKKEVSKDVAEKIKGVLLKGVKKMPSMGFIKNKMVNLLEGRGFMYSFDAKNIGRYTTSEQKFLEELPFKAVAIGVILYSIFPPVGAIFSTIILLKSFILGFAGAKKTLGMTQDVVSARHDSLFNPENSSSICVGSKGFGKVNLGLLEQKINSSDLSDAELKLLLNSYREVQGVKDGQNGVHSKNSSIDTESRDAKLPYDRDYSAKSGFNSHIDAYNNNKEVQKGSSAKRGG